MTGPFRLGRSVTRFLNDLLYLKVGEGPMTLAPEISATADILQQGWARREMRFSSSSFPLTTIAAPDAVRMFLDDPSFVSPGYPEKAIVRSTINRVVWLNLQPDVSGPTSSAAWVNGEGVTVQLSVILFRGDTFNGLTIPNDGVILRRFRITNTAIYYGWFPFGYEIQTAANAFVAQGNFSDPIFVPAGWGLGVQAQRSSGNWVAANDLGMMRAAILDVPKELKPY